MRAIAAPIVLFAALGLNAGEGPEPAGASRASAQPLPGLEAFVDGVIAARMETAMLPGVTVSIVKDGEIALLKGYGHADLEHDVAVDPSRSLFQIGSITKTFTSLAVMQLVERGKLDLDADVNEYLTGFRLPDTFEQPVTLRAILSHRPGFEVAELGHLMYDDAAEVPETGQYLATHMPARVRPPGETVSYSNYGFALAGYVVAQVTGQDFASYLRENVLAPLGMHHTTVADPLGETHPEAMDPALVPDIAVGYAAGAGGRPEAQPVAFVHHVAAAGSIRSTAADMARYMIARLNGDELDGKRLVEPATTRAMRERLYHDRPLAIDIAHGMFEGTMDGVRFRGHGGGTTTFISNMMLYPELDLGIFISTNSAEGSETAGDLPRLVVEAFFPHGETTAIPQPPNDFVERGQKYAGSYMTTRRNYTQLEKVAQQGVVQVRVDDEGYLVLDDGSDTHRFVEVEPGVFRRADERFSGAGGLSIDYIYFYADDDGRPIRFSLPAADFERVSFLESPRFLHLAIALAALLSVTTLLRAWRRVGTWRRLGRDRATSGMSRIGGIAAVTAATLVLGMVVDVALIALGGIDDVSLLFEWPGRLVPVLYLILLFTAVTAALLVLVPLVWRRADWGLPRRIHFTAFALVCLTLVYVFNEWNLIGFRYFA